MTTTTTSTTTTTLPLTSRARALLDALRTADAPLVVAVERSLQARFAAAASTSDEGSRIAVDADAVVACLRAARRHGAMVVVAGPRREPPRSAFAAPIPSMRVPKGARDRAPAAA